MRYQCKIQRFNQHFDLLAEASEPADDKFDSKVKVLGQYIDHHVKEERNEMFPKARRAKKLDLLDLRDQMAARKAELLPPQPSVMWRAGNNTSDFSAAAAGLMLRLKLRLNFSQK